MFENVSNFCIKYFFDQVFDFNNIFSDFLGNFRNPYQNYKANCYYFTFDKDFQNFREIHKNIFFETKNRSKKYFLGKLKKIGHQSRQKISLRIECEHSQPLKATLQYSSGCQHYFFAENSHFFHKITVFDTFW